MSKQLQHRPTFEYKSNNLFSSNIHTRFNTRMTKLEISQVIVFIEDNKIHSTYTMYYEFGMVVSSIFASKQY